MQLFAFIAASVSAAEWNGQSEAMPCGGEYTAAQASMVNSTCTVTGENINRIMVGNGAFITGTNTFTGFDGISGAPDAIVYFDQVMNEDGSMDNSTCWEATISCTDNGVATDGLYFMDTVNSVGPGFFNLQIAGVSAGDTLSFNLGTQVNNITASFASVTASLDVWNNNYASDGVFSIKVEDDATFGDLFQLSVNDVNGGLNLYSASVSA